MTLGQILIHAAQNRNINLMDIKVLMILQFFSNKGEMENWATISNIHHKLSVSKGKVRRSLKNIEKYGYIMRENKRLPNKYESFIAYIKI